MNVLVVIHSASAAGKNKSAGKGKASKASKAKASKGKASKVKAVGGKASKGKPTSKGKASKGNASKGNASKGKPSKSTGTEGKGKGAKAGKKTSKKEGKEGSAKPKKMAEADTVGSKGAKKMTEIKKQLAGQQKTEPSTPQPELETGTGQGAIELQTLDPLPANYKRPMVLAGDQIFRVYKATYEANDPSEDRSTLALDLDAGQIFAGVWDGHGGAPSSFRGVWPWTKCVCFWAVFLRRRANVQLYRRTKRSLVAFRQAAESWAGTRGCTCICIHCRGKGVLRAWQTIVF